MSLADVQSWGLCLHWEKASIVLLPFAQWGYWIVSVQVKGSRWISGRSVSKAGRVQTFPLICLQLGRIVLPQ